MKTITFDDLVTLAREKLSGARVVETGNGEIAILTNLQQEVYSGANDTWYTDPHLVPFRDVVGGEL